MALSMPLLVLPRALASAALVGPKPVPLLPAGFQSLTNKAVWSAGQGRMGIHRAAAAPGGQRPLDDEARSVEMSATKVKRAERLLERDVMEGKLFDLSGSVAFVTGAARGMGAAIAVGLAKSGSKVVVSDRVPEEEMRPVVDRIRALGGEAIGLQCDVSSRKAVDDAVKRGAEHFGGLHIMVANAGILGKLTRAESVPQHTWHEVMAVNVEGAYNCCRAAYPYMRGAGYGKVILISSIAGIRGFGAQVAYCASKGALLPLAKSLAVAWGEDNIQANTIVGGAINTPFLNQVLNTPEKVQSILSRIPAGRLGVAEDVVGPAVFLASHASDYVTGTEIIVDGGGTQLPMLTEQLPEEYKL